MAAHSIPPAQDEAPTTELVSGTVGSHCANCHAPLAPDQRYCLNCGARRGKPRFPAGAGATRTTEVVSETGPPRRTPRGAGLTLVAGIATLLIAMGVGVLIGQKSGGNTGSGPVKVIQLGSGGGPATNASANGPSTPAASSAKSHSKSAKSTHAAKGQTKKTKTVVVHLTPKVQKAATNAASKVFGSSGRLSKNVTQKVGGSCSGGAGCQNGKFTGNFFGQ